MPSWSLAFTVCSFTVGGRVKLRRKRVVAPLAMQRLAVLAVALAGVFLSLGRDRQRVVFQGDVHIILLEAGQLGLDVDVVAVLTDVHCVWCQPTATVLGLAVKQPDEQVIEVPLGGLERIDALIPNNSGR